MSELIALNITNETISATDGSAEVEYLCDQHSRWNYAAYFLGGLIGGYYVPPMVYAACTGLVVKEVSMSPMGKTYGFPPYTKLSVKAGKPECKDSQSQDPLDVMTIDVKLAGEAFPRAKKSLVWGSDAPSDLSGSPLREDEDNAPQIIIPTISLSITYKWALTFNIDTIKQYVGRVNAVAMSDGQTTYAAGKDNSPTTRRPPQRANAQ